MVTMIDFEFAQAAGVERMVLAPALQAIRAHYNSH